MHAQYKTDVRIKNQCDQVDVAMESLEDNIPVEYHEEDFTLKKIIKQIKLLLLDEIHTVLDRHIKMIRNYTSLGRICKIFQFTIQEENMLMARIKMKKFGLGMAEC